MGSTTHQLTNPYLPRINNTHLMRPKRLGWQQLEILRRLREQPGQSSLDLLKGLSRTNRPEKKLMDYGLINDKSEPPNGPTNPRRWELTDDGLAELERRGL